MFYSPSLKLGRRDSVSVGEMAAEKKGGECETTSDSETLLGEENGGKQEEEWGRKN